MPITAESITAMPAASDSSRRDVRRARVGSGRAAIPPASAASPRRRRDPPPHALAAAAIAALALPLASGEPADTDWPQLGRDARRSGDAPHIVIEPPLRRTLALRFPAAIYASPAVVGGGAYVQDARGNLACVDLASGRTRWVTALGGINNASSPAVAHGRVYVGSTAGFLAVLDAATGSLQQRVPVEGGVLAAPAIIGETIYALGRGGELLRLRPDGSVAWRRRVGRICIGEFAADAAGALVPTGDDGSALVRVCDAGGRGEIVERTAVAKQMCPTSGISLGEDGTPAFQCYDSEFGSFLWNGRLLAVDGHDGRGVPARRGDLIVRGDKAWSLAGADRARLRGDPQGGGRDLPLAWRVDPRDLYDGGSHGSPALARDHAVLGDERGGVQFIPLAGPPLRRPVWRWQAPGAAGRANAAFSSSPALVPGLVLIGGEDGLLVGLGPGSEAQETALPQPAPEPAEPAEPLPAGPEWATVGGGMGFAGVATGRWPAPPLRLRWWTRVWSAMKASPVVAGGRAVAAGRSGSLTALDAATGEILWRSHHPGVESRPAATIHRDAVLVARIAGSQAGSPHSIGRSGGPPGAGLWCHDLATGALRWHVPAVYAYQFNADGVCAQGDRVFHLRPDADGRLLAEALDVRSGAALWTSPLPHVVTRKGLPPRCAAVVEGERWIVSVCGSASGGGVTAAFDCASGALAWADPGLGIAARRRTASRDGTLVVFAADAIRAVDAASGRRLWEAPYGQPKPADTMYQFALTDEFMASRGVAGRFPYRVGGCHLPLWADGFWYCHDPSDRWSANRLVAVPAGAPPGDAQGDPPRDGAFAWTQPFLSNACASPAFAYGRLYYAPNGEGVVYCFAGG